MSQRATSSLWRFEGVIPAHAAGDATTGHVVFRAPFNCKVVRVVVIPGAGVTGAATNNYGLTLYNRGTDGTGTTSLASVTFAAGTNETAFAPRVLYAPTNPLEISEGTILDITRVLNGTGLASPHYFVYVDVWPN